MFSYYLAVCLHKPEVSPGFCSCFSTHPDGGSSASHSSVVVFVPAILLFNFSLLCAFIPLYLLLSAYACLDFRLYALSDYSREHLHASLSGSTAEQTWVEYKNCAWSPFSLSLCCPCHHCLTRVVWRQLAKKKRLTTFCNLILKTALRRNGKEY